MSRSLERIIQRLLQTPIKVSKTIKTLKNNYKLTFYLIRSRRWRPRERIKSERDQKLLFSSRKGGFNFSALLASSLYSSLLIRFDQFQGEFIVSGALFSLSRGVFLRFRGQILSLYSEINCKIVSKYYKSTIKYKNTYTLGYSAYYYYSNSSQYSSP